MIDVGTGDGRAVLAAATAQPATLAIGVDADAPSMAESSRRAARSPRRGGLPNAMFLVAAAEDLPSEIRGLAERVTVRFPWGSLLRGCLGTEPAVAAGLAELLAPGGTLELLIAAAARDRLPAVPTEPSDVIGAVELAFSATRLRLVEGRPATPDEVRASGSTWARRLRTNGGAERTTILVRLRS